MYAFASSAVVAALIVSSLAIPAPDAGAKSFTLQNGKDAIALNDKFQSLTASSKCTDGEDACVNGKFAQCANGKFVTTECVAGTICSALPLVNKPGTAVTCTTTEDRDRRLAATGATDGSGADTGSTASDDASGAENAAAQPAADTPDAGADTTPDAGAKSFTLQNGQDAIALNDKFQSLTPDFQCTDGEDACVNGKFAQCANGKFVTTECAAGTICSALPLVNKPGTAVTCTTTEDRDRRLAATGATDSSGADASDGADASGVEDVAAQPAADTSDAGAEDAATSDAATEDAAPESTGVDLLQNGKDAQAQNAKNAALTPDSACTEGENACINNEFAQCADGAFVLTPCGGGLQCFALPLLKKAGISNTCVTEAEAAQRIKDTGAGSLDGN